MIRKNIRFPNNLTNVFLIVSLARQLSRLTLALTRALDLTLTLPLSPGNSAAVLKTIGFG